MRRIGSLSLAREVLREAGIDAPERDASLLWREFVEPHVTDDMRVPPPGGPLRRFEAAILRRLDREPVSHILGRRAFWEAEFEVTPDVLDPRPETETLVKAARDLVEPWRARRKWGASDGEREDAPHEPFAGRVLDLGTGSGCVLCSVLGNHPRATGLGTDLSEAALAVARRNAERTGVAARAAFLRADWWEGIEGRFDLVVSNPPYVSEDEMAGLAPEVLREPRMALTPGGDGLDAYRAIASGAADGLAPGGAVLVEVGPTQAATVAALFHAAGLDETWARTDLDGRARVVGARMAG